MNANANKKPPAQDLAPVYPRIGSDTLFQFYHFNTKKVVKGMGKIKALFVDPQGHLSAQVVASQSNGETQAGSDQCTIQQGSAYNVKFSALNHDSELTAKIEQAHAAVDMLAADGNKRVSSIVEKSNKEVDAVYNTVYGDTITF